MKKVIVIGATSGIGKGLAELFLNKDYTVGIIGRRKELLEAIKSENKGNCICKAGDVTDIPETKRLLTELYNELGGLDLVIISAGTGEINPQLDFALEEPTLKTNVLAFTHLVDWAYLIFEKQKKGHLVAITSVAGIRGDGVSPSYNASKAYQMNYLEGIRKKAFKQRLPIYVTDIRPGFVDTAMAKGEGLFWVAPVDKAVQQISRAIDRRKKKAYITKRWKYIAYILRILPTSIYKRI